MDIKIDSIRAEMHPLDEDRGEEYPDSVNDYFQRYGLDSNNKHTEHIFGSFESNGYILAGHIFKCDRSKGTVFLLHGYLNHCWQLRHLIGFLVEHGYSVASFDLPGHGLSTGSRGGIDNFSKYSGALDDFIKSAGKALDKPFHVIGFSTGACAVMDYLLDREDVFDSVILAAPLVRFRRWRQAKAGLGMLGIVTDSVPRITGKISSDREYLKAVRTDPMQVRKVPMEWISALYNWNDKITEKPACEKKVTIIQGILDRTVDWRFNVEFISERFADVETFLIVGARHDLFNETADIRGEVFSRIIKILPCNRGL